MRPLVKLKQLVKPHSFVASMRGLTEKLLRQSAKTSWLSSLYDGWLRTVLLSGFPDGSDDSSLGNPGCCLSGFIPFCVGSTRRLEAIKMLAKMSTEHAKEIPRSSGKLEASDALMLASIDMNVAGWLGGGVGGGNIGLGGGGVGLGGRFGGGDGGVGGDGDGGGSGCGEGAGGDGKRGGGK
eukprot:1409997-Pleurochrysis_carterae.AAC.1